MAVGAFAVPQTLSTRDTKATSAVKPNFCLVDDRKKVGPEFLNCRLRSVVAKVFKAVLILGLLIMVLLYVYSAYVSIKVKVPREPSRFSE